nr:ribonuclease H-like domain-containing protein [Tanacetum cinerariifolium]GFA68672.1 ribonuclease H-like domain-containing protein [Tanacetum cinerariifolium]
PWQVVHGSHVFVDVSLSCGRRGYDDKFSSIVHSLLASVPLLGTRIKRGTAAMSDTCKRLLFPVSCVLCILAESFVIRYGLTLSFYADIFTKGLPSALFEDFRSSLSVRPPPAQTARAY